MVWRGKISAYIVMNYQLRQELYDLSADCENVAKQLEQQPMMCSSPEVIIDLYRTVNRLSMILLKLKG